MSIPALTINPLFPPHTLSLLTLSNCLSAHRNHFFLKGSMLPFLIPFVLFLLESNKGVKTYSYTLTIPNPPADLELGLSREYAGKVYVVFKPRKIWWLTAQKQCERLYGRLAVPSNREIYRFLLSLLREYYVRLSVAERHECRGFHVGGRLIDHTQWIPQNMSFCHGEPKGQGECAEISTLNGFCVNDFNCALLGFVSYISPFQSFCFEKMKSNFNILMNG
ncbi:hypothetical protein ACOME3_002203 [Neoechinorhynchus agilis]